jgi:hypothetical protein
LSPIHLLIGTFRRQQPALMATAAAVVSTCCHSWCLTRITQLRQQHNHIHCSIHSRMPFTAVMSRSCCSCYRPGQIAFSQIPFQACLAGQPSMQLSLGPDLCRS